MRTGLIFLAAALLSACGQSPDSINALFNVSLDEKPISRMKVSLRCTYAWDYFSERDMAVHYKATAEPTKAPRVLASLPDHRLLTLVPEPWPPIDSDDRCNFSAVHGWQALVLDPLRPVPLLTLVRSDESSASLAGLAMSVEAGHTSAPAAQDMKGVAIALRQAVEKATSLDFVVMDVPREGDTLSPAGLSPEAVQALSALPAARPSVLQPAMPANTPLDLNAADKDATLTGLPGFDVAKVMGDNAFSTYPSMPDLPITIDPNRPRGKGKVYFPSDVPTPSVTLPDLKEPLPIAPVVAVWYPDFRKLIVISWSKRHRELARWMD